jgi:uncharacterized protein (TIGR02246 family)
MKRAFIVSALIVCVAGSAFGGEVEKSIRAMAENFEAGVKAGNVDQVISIYAEDAVVMPPNMPVVSGRDAVRQFWAGMLAMGKAEIDIMIDDISVSGDMAVERGTWSLTVMPEGASSSVKDNGKYLIVWRNRGGKWQAVSDIWNSDLALAK